LVGPSLVRLSRSPRERLKLAASASVTLHVGVQGVSAVIAGGTNRILSVNRDNFLDATESTDLDYPQQTPKFTWSCIQVHPSFGGACSRFTVPPNVKTNTNSSALNSVWLLSAGGIAAQSVYNFTVIVSSTKSFCYASFSQVITMIILSPYLPYPTPTF